MRKAETQGSLGSGKERAIQEAGRLAMAGVVTIIVTLMGCSSRSDMTSYLPEMRPVIPPIFDELIVLGRRVGPVSLGMHVRDLYGAMGSPDQVLKYSDGTTGYSWNRAGIFTAVWDRTQQVFRITVESPTYATAEGIRVGTTELEVQAKLGPPIWARPAGRGESHLLCYANRTEIRLTGYATSTPGRVKEIRLNACVE